jgi:glycosyltransferase involved in cell wall biosynthesis
MQIADKKKLLIFYEYFLPGYKAGGPIQSLSNLILALQNRYNIFVVTTSYDLGATIPYPNILNDDWNTILYQDVYIKVWYSSKPTYLSFNTINYLLNKVEPDYIYLNGIYTFSFVTKPLLYLFLKKSNSKIFICPRGMLQQGALSVKPLKKKLYFLALKFILKRMNIVWHATSSDEQQDIYKSFGNNQIVYIANNIPRKPLPTAISIRKDSGVLRLIFLSVITEKKNILFLLQLIEAASLNIQLDIFGPIKDEVYWQNCKAIIRSHPLIKYCGDVQPHEVQSLFSNYHALILPTKGENFGHAIYECLSVGRPVITSYYTPWNDLEVNNAGWNIDISNMKNCISYLKKISMLTNTEFNEFCNGSFRLATNYYNNLNINNYYQLFS